MLIQTLIPVRRDGTVLVDVPSGVHYVFAGEPPVCEVADTLDAQWLLALAGGARFVVADALSADDGGEGWADPPDAAVVASGVKKPRGRPRRQPVLSDADPEADADPDTDAG